MANNKEHIRTVALELFAAKGYGDTSIATIAKEAEVSQGLMYNFYASKEELLFDILNQGFENIKLSMIPYAEEKDPRIAITLHIKRTFALVQRDTAYWKLFHSMRTQDSVKEYLASNYAEAQQDILKTLTANFKKMDYAHPKFEARLFFATLDGLVNHYLMDAETFSLKHIEKHFIQNYLL